MAMFVQVYFECFRLWMPWKWCGHLAKSWKQAYHSSRMTFLKRSHFTFWPWKTDSFAMITERKCLFQTYPGQISWPTQTNKKVNKYSSLQMACALLSNAVMETTVTGLHMGMRVDEGGFKKTKGHCSPPQATNRNGAIHVMGIMWCDDLQVR